MTWLCTAKQQPLPCHWAIGGGERAVLLTQSACTGFRLDHVLSDIASLGIGSLSVRCTDPPFDVAAGQFIRAAPGWRCLSDAHKAWFVLADAVVVIPRSQPLVEVLLSPRRRTWPSELLGQIFGCALHALLQPHGLHYLHGAGLVAPNSETGVLIVGASGSGKSTLTLQLAASGWRYLTDDLLLLNGCQQQSDAAILAHGFRRHFAVSREALRHSGLLKTASAETDEQKDKTRKHWLLPEKLFPVGYVAQCVPHVLIFPQITNARESQVEPISPHDALLAVLQETPLVSYDPAITRAQVNTLTRLVAQTRAWRLHAGHDLLLQPERASQLLTRLL